MEKIISNSNAEVFKTDESFSFERLSVWQEARNLVRTLYKVIGTFPNTEKYVLGDQLRRAVVSVPSNIAEGSGRFSSKEKIRFIEIAYAFLMEVYCQLLLAFDLGYISEIELTQLKENIQHIAKMLNGLKRSFGGIG